MQTERSFKLEFHGTDTDTDILARISPTRPTRAKLFLWQAERHVDILATIFARMSARMSVSASWNASFTDDILNAHAVDVI